MLKDLTIRPAEMKDAHDINTLRRMPGVMENMLALPSESVIKNEKFIVNSNEDDHIFVADLREQDRARVIGVASLHVRKNARLRHSAVISIMVHADFHGRKIGSHLMQALTDLADNWLMLMRLELSVYPDNPRAIKLYEKFGFVSEGIARYSSVKGGIYADTLQMARYHYSLRGGS